MGQASRCGDAQAFTELVRRWDYRVLAFLTKATGDREAARDLRQEVFLRIHRYGATYDPSYAFSTWLFRIVSNVLATWQATRRRTAATEPVSEKLRDPSPDPGDCAVRTELASAVRAAIGHLSPAERELLLQRFNLNLSYREMAEIQGIPETTVKSRVYALLHRLRRSLDQTASQERSPNS